MMTWPAMTPTVEIYGMVSFEYGGQSVYRPVTLVGIVPEGKNMVSPMTAYLENRQQRPDQPLNWDLPKDFEEPRKDWIERRQAKVNAQAAEMNAHSEADAEPDTFHNPFNDAPVKPQVSTALQPTRVYIGAGLISYPFIDRATGQARIQKMVLPGHDVTLHTVKAGRPESQSWRATVVDVFKSGMCEYDSNLVFCNIEELQRARGMLLADKQDWKEGNITSLQLRLKNYTDAPKVVELLRTNLSLHRYQVVTWESKQGPLLEAVEVESAILNVLLFLIIAVAGFGILAIFTMIVVEKTRDIGILKALGASGRGVMSIFLGYGLALGVVGAGAGVGLGLLFVRYINQVEAGLSWVTGRKVFDETIYYFKEIPTNVRPGMVFSVALGAIVIAVLASVFPARRAAALQPVQALRYE